MFSLARIAAVFAVFIAVYFFSYWIFFAHIVPETVGFLATLLALFTGILAARYVWRKLGSEGGGRGLFAYAALGAGLVGAAGFIGGFFGPMIFSPESNQGPLLGIFITGPLGFCGGGLAGLLYGLWKKK